MAKAKKPGVWYPLTQFQPSKRLIAVRAAFRKAREDLQALADREVRAYVTASGMAKKIQAKGHVVAEVGTGFDKYSVRVASATEAKTASKSSAKSLESALGVNAGGGIEDDELLEQDQGQ